MHAVGFWEATRTMITGAVFSTGRQYRYALWRVWDEVLPTVTFIGLNPSTADEFQDDPTLRRCMGYARGWGFGGVFMGNAFALRSTNPRGLREVSDPVGPLCDHWLQAMAQRAALVVAAWGNQGAYRNRDQDLLQSIEGLHCLGYTKTGQPKHPLYLPKGLFPVPFTERCPE